MQIATENLGFETADALAEGDPAKTIRTLNNLRQRLLLIWGHFNHEIKETRELAANLAAREDRRVVDVVEAKIDTVSQDVGTGLMDLARRFNVEL